MSCAEVYDVCVISVWVWLKKPAFPELEPSVNTVIALTIGRTCMILGKINVVTRANWITLSRG